MAPSRADSFFRARHRQTLKTVELDKRGNNIPAHESGVVGFVGMLRGTRGRQLTALCSALVCFGLAGEAAGQTGAPTPGASSRAADFDALVKKGDQARIAGKWSDALHAYAGALELRNDRLVAGRLGLVLLELREYLAAAGKLSQAVELGVGTSDAERMRFFRAYLVARNQVCRLDVAIAQNGVKFAVDDEPQLKGRHDFWTFVKPGKHTLRASLEGFEDETMVIDAPKGGRLPIKFDLHPVKPAEEPTKQPDAEPRREAPDPPLHADKPAPVIVEDNPPAPTNPPWKNGSFVFGLGLGVVFEATPTPAMGPHAFVAWRSRSWWDVGVDARVAWMFVEDKRAPTTQFVTWSAMVVPCGRWWKQRLLGCGLLELDGVQRMGTRKGGLLPGLGIRVGLEFETLPWMSLQIFGDVVVHEDGFRWELPDRTTSRTGSWISGTLSLRALFKP